MRVKCSTTATARMRRATEIGDAIGQLTRAYTSAAVLSIFGSVRTSERSVASLNQQPLSSSLPTRLDLPGGTAVDYDYGSDPLGRLLSTTLRDASYTPLNRHAYVYNDASQRTQQTFTDGHYSDYGYDAIGQLQTAVGTDVAGSTPTPRLHEQFGYGYDAAWNLNRRTNNALIQTFNTDNRNQLTTVTRTGSLAVGEDSYDRKG